LARSCPLKLNEIWAIRIGCNWQDGPENSRCSTSPLTASYAAVTWLGCASTTWSPGVASPSERPVQFEITEQTRFAITAWITAAHLKPEQFLFPSRVSESPHLSTRQYSRIVGSWVECIGLDPEAYGTHSLRRTNATLIYRRTRNLRAVQLLLVHTKLESTVRYLGIEVDDALEIAERTEV